MLAALSGVFLSDRLGDPSYDGRASIVIGVILASVALLLVYERIARRRRRRSERIKKTARPLAVRGGRRGSQENSHDALWPSNGVARDGAPIPSGSERPGNRIDRRDFEKKDPRRTP